MAILLPTHTVRLGTNRQAEVELISTWEVLPTMGITIMTPMNTRIMTTTTLTTLTTLTMLAGEEVVGWRCRG